MSTLLSNVTNSIWHAFNSLSSDKSGVVMKSKLKVSLSSNILSWEILGLAYLWLCKVMASFSQRETYVRSYSKKCEAYI